MEVSNFELIFKPQAPSAPTGTVAVERVIQGYFLEITNLEDTEFRYLIEFVAPPPPPGSPNQEFRGLLGNVITFVDVPGTDNQQGILAATGNPEVFRLSTGFVRIPPRATALVAVLPSVFGPVPGDPTPITLPVFEVRGYVRISLPALFRPPPPFQFFSFPQSATPVRVLLTPQNRSTFLTATGSISDQVQASLPLASGAALNIIPPEPGGPLIVVPIDPVVAFPRALSLLEGISEQDRAALLVSLLGQIDPETTDMRIFNTTLADAKIPLSVERRKAKGA